MNKFNIFKKIELVISHPHRFFDKIQKEKNIWNVFKFYFIFVFLSTIINTLFLLPEIIKSKLDISFLSYLVVIIVLILFVLLIIFLTALSSFVVYYLYHILIKLFRGKKRYPETYKLLLASFFRHNACLIVSIIN